MTISGNTSIIQYFYHWEKTTPQKVFLKQPINGVYHDITYQEAGRQARIMASYLKSLGLPAQSNIGLLSKNCAEWFITDLAIMMSGHVSVPFYPTLTADQLNLVLTHSESCLLFVGKLDNWASMKPGIPASVPCISFPTYNPDPSHTQWQDILTKYEPITDSPAPPIGNLMTIVYTSGTTGNPKGVMLTHYNFATMLEAMVPYLQMKTQETRFFSYLPLCHIAERAYLENSGIAMGSTFYFAESLESFAKNLAEARPTHIGSVPRIWAKFQHGVLAKMPQKKLNLLLSIPIISSLVKTKIRKTLGLNDAVLVVVGAAPMPVSLNLWFRRLGITIQELYGMTENTGAMSAMPFEKIKDGTVGKVHPGVQIKFDKNTHEICAKMPWNMVGYYKEPQMTAETIDEEGFLHTGDVGIMDDEGYLTITGRVKEMYKTSKGEYVAPAQIEMKFSDNTNIEQICVVGNHLPQPIALVVLSEEARQMDKKEVIDSLTTSMDAINPVLKPYEKIIKMVVMKEPWTIENNKLTPTMKLKRNVIENIYAPYMEKWAEAKDKIVWE